MSNKRFDGQEVSGYAAAIADIDIFIFRPWHLALFLVGAHR